MLKQSSLILICSLGLAAGLCAQDGKLLYENNFDKGKAGPVPEEMLVLDGAFVIKVDGANKLLELPGSPLGDNPFGILFGPTEPSDIEVSVRILATSKGRRHPIFGPGVNGVGGYRLQVSPGKKQLELFRGEDVAASKEFEWAANSWTMFKLQIRKVEGGMQVQGKVWKQGTDEPKDWQISHLDKAETPVAAGRPSIWGNPVSGNPIQFDDLKVVKLEKK